MSVLFLPFGGIRRGISQLACGTALQHRRNSKKKTTTNTTTTLPGSVLGQAVYRTGIFRATTNADECAMSEIEREREREMR
jgi:hypothetical protein